MDIFSQFANTFRREPNQIPRKELALFSVAILREAIRIEHDNTGSPGKAAIEFLLNTKYQIAESRDLELYIRNMLLSEVDNVIKKVVAKFGIERRNNKFYFDEAIETIAMTIQVKTPEQLLCDAQVKLELLKQQLAKTDLQSAESTILTKQIKDQENLIKDLKLNKARSNNKWDPVYRRSIGV